MAYTVELDIKRLEPVRLEFMQGSYSETVFFKLPGYEPPEHEFSVELQYRDPHGIYGIKSCVWRDDGAYFEAVPSTFVVPGRYVATLGIFNMMQASGYYNSFPVIIDVINNPGIRRWEKTANERVLAAGQSFAISESGFEPTGSKAYIYIGDGAYTVTAGNSVTIPTAENGQITVAYAITGDSFVNTFTVTNISDSPIRVPQIKFEAYMMAQQGSNPMTGTLTEMEARTIESVRVSGVATLNRGYSKTCGSFDRMPEADLTLYGRSGGYNTIIKSGIPVDGTWVTDGDAEFSLNQTYRWVVVGALNNTTILNYDQLFARATVYEEAE